MEGFIFGGILVASVVGTGFAVHFAIEQNKEWQQFKQVHHCKVVSQARGDVYITNGFDSKGNMVTGTAVSPDKTGWLCDDGVIYYR